MILSSAFPEVLPEPQLDPQNVRWLWQTLMGIDQVQIDLEEKLAPATDLDEELLQVEAILSIRDTF